MTAAADFEAAKNAAGTEAARCRLRDEAFAALVATVLDLAAQQCPETLRQAIARVFDVNGLEQQYERLYLLLNAATTGTEECRDKLADATRRIRELERRLEALEYDYPART